MRSRLFPLVLLTLLALLSSCTTESIEAEPIISAPADPVTDPDTDPVLVAERAACLDVGPAGDQVGYGLMGGPGACVLRRLSDSEQECAALQSEKLQDTAQPIQLPEVDHPIGVRVDDVTTLGAPIPRALLDEIAALEGVIRAEGSVTAIDDVFLLTADETPLTNGEPVILADWSSVPEPSLVEGREPQTGNEIAVSEVAAEVGALEIGQRYDVLGPLGPDNFEVVGIFSSAGADAIIYAVTLEEASRLVAGGGGYTEIHVWADEPLEPLQSAIQRIVEGYGFGGTTELSRELRQKRNEASRQSVISFLDISTGLLCITANERSTLVSALAERQVELSEADCTIFWMLNNPFEEFPARGICS